LSPFMKATAVGSSWPKLADAKGQMSPKSMSEGCR